VDIFQKLALSTAGRALVHHHHLVFIGSDDPGGGGVGGDPALLLADVQQNTVNALFSGGAGIEIIGENLMQIPAAAVNHHLLSIEAGMAEGRRYVNDGPGCEFFQFPDVDERLQLRYGEGKKRCVSRADQRCLVAVIIPAGLEGHQYQLLGGKPLKRLLAHLGKRIAIDILKPGLVRGLVIGDAHTVWVPAAHIVLGIIDHGPVFAAYHIRLVDRPALHIVHHIDPIGVLIAENQFIERLLALWHDDAGTAVHDGTQFLRQYKALQYFVQFWSPRFQFL